MGMIRILCKKVMLIEEGLLKRYKSSVNEIISEYNNYTIKTYWKYNKKNLYNDYVIPKMIYITDKNNNAIIKSIERNEDIYLNIKLYITKNISGLNIGYALYSDNDDLIYYSSMIDKNECEWPILNNGNNHLITKIPMNFLNEGKYRIELRSVLHPIRWIIPPNDGPSVFFEIRGGLSESQLWQKKRPGILAPILDCNNIN